MSGSGFFDFQERLTQQKQAAKTPAGGSTESPLTVTELTGRIDRALRAGLPAAVLVKGELSNVKHHSQSGHLYFTLKDDKNTIDAVMFAREASRLMFTAEDGMEILATGRVQVYGARGKYQFYANTLQPLGKGALELAFRQLQQKLSAEGLFDENRKRHLPRYPSRITLLTSLSTAALQDMLKVLRRYPWIRLSIYHVAVQGASAAPQIADALRRAGREWPADLVLLARGGGSLEDLWAFNEEIVARAVADCAAPVISGIGHEVDVSIADLVADYHAHTPTEAAQVAVSGWKPVKDVLDVGGLRLRRGLRTIVNESRQRLVTIRRHEMFRRPTDVVDRLRQLVDDRHRSLQLAMTRRTSMLHRRLNDLSNRLMRNRPAAIIQRLRNRLADAMKRLSERHPRHTLTTGRMRIESMEARLTRAMRAQIDRSRQRVDASARHLRAIGHQQVLARGYSITTLKRTGEVLRSPAQVQPGDRIVSQLAEGQIASTVGDAKQMSLFE